LHHANAKAASDVPRVAEVTAHSLKEHKVFESLKQSAATGDSSFHPKPKSGSTDAKHSRFCEQESVSLRSLSKHRPRVQPAAPSHGSGTVSVEALFSVGAVFSVGVVLRQLERR